MKILVSLAGLTILTSCAASHDAKFLAMSEDELAAYNASVPLERQVSCIEQHKPGTMHLVQKVCSRNEQRLARLTGSAGTDRGPIYHRNYGYSFSSGNLSYGNREGNLPRIFFSQPPPGYDRPVIHVIDGRRY